MPAEKRTGDRLPNPVIGKTTRYNKLVRFIDLNRVIGDVNFENSSLHTVKDLKAVDVEDRPYGSYFNVLGYHGPNDLGGGMFFWDPNSTDTEDNGLVIKSDQVSTGRWYRLVGDYITPEMFGAVGDGITKDTKAVQSCLEHGSKIKLTKHYLLDSVSGKKSSYNIIGDKGSKLDFSLNNGSDYELDYSDIKFQGSYTQIANLSTSPARKDTTISFSSAHELLEGDVFTIHNPTDFSWNSSRAYYQAGEMCEVKRVISSTEVEVMIPLYDSYNHTVVDVYRLNPIKLSIEGVNIIGNDRYGLQIVGARDLQLKNLAFEGVFRHTVQFTNTYNATVDSINITHSNDPSIYGYGLLYGASQNVNISNCTINSRVDSIESSSGAPLDGFRLYIPSRQINIHNIYGTHVVSQHGHAEYTYVSNVFCKDIILGGDRGYVSNSTTRGNIALAREGVGMNFSVTGCTVHGDIYYVNQVSNGKVKYIDEIQNVRVENNTVYNSISLPGIGESVSYTLHLFVKGNIVQPPTDVNGVATAPSISTAGNTNSTANLIIVENNICIGHLDIRTRDGAENIAKIKGNHVSKGKRSSLILHQGYVYFENNTIIDTFRSNANAILDTNVAFSDAKRFYVLDNTMGDTENNINGQWLSFSNTTEIYLSNNNSLNQQNKDIYFNPASSGSLPSHIKPYFTGTSNPVQGKATILATTNSITISGLNINPEYSNIQLTGTNSEVSSCIISTTTANSFTIQTGDASNVTADRDVYWKL